VLRSVLIAGLAVSVVAGAGVVGLRTLGEQAKGTFETLNRAFEDSVPREGKASARDAADWIERYRSGAGGARCRPEPGDWDYVCIFKDGDGRRRKMGVIVDARQPTQMSPLVGVRQRLPTPGYGA
jgi:hypothetical protein